MASNKEFNRYPIDEFHRLILDYGYVRYLNYIYCILI